jgi:hypothetical protein
MSQLNFDQRPGPNASGVPARGAKLGMWAESPVVTSGG